MFTTLDLKKWRTGGDGTYVTDSIVYNKEV